MAKVANFGVARNAERDILTLTFTNVQMLQRQVIKWPQLLNVTCIEGHIDDQ